MPDLTNVKVVSPLKSFKTPTLTEYGSTIGSSDTVLGRMTGAYMDTAFAGYQDQQNQRYANQGVVNSIGNFFGDLGVKTVAGIPSLLGSIYGVGKGSFTKALGGEFTTGFKDNPLLNLADTISLWGTENFPHMLEEDFQEKNFLSQLNPFSSGGQILTSNVETLAFLAQSFGTAGASAAFKLGTKAAPLLSKVNIFKSNLNALQAPNLAKIASNVDDITLNAFLTTNEAAQEALDAKNTAIEKLQLNRRLGKNDLSDRQIEELADNTLSNVFWSNMTTLGATNYVFGKLISPIFSPKAIESRGNKWALDKMTGNKLVTDPNIGLTKFQRFLLDEGHAAGMTTKALATQFLSEGIEESSQYSIQKVNEISDNQRNFKEAFGDYLKDLIQHGLDFSDPDREKAFGLGALMGTVSTAAISGSELGPYKQAKNFRERQKAYLDALNTKFNALQDTSLLKFEKDVEGRVFSKEDEETKEPKYFLETEDQIVEIGESTYNKYLEDYSPDKDGKFVIKGKLLLDEEGKPLKDEIKSAQFAETIKIQTEFDNLIDAEALKPSPDNLKLDLYKLSKLESLAQTAFESGTVELLIDKLNSFKTLSEEGVIELGFTSKQDLDGEVDKWVSYIEDLEKNYNSTLNGLITSTATQEDQAKFVTFKSAALSQGARVATVDTLIRDIDNQINSLDVDSEVINALKADKLSQLFPYKTDSNKVAENTLAARLVVKQKELQKHREQLISTYKKFFEPEAFEIWKKSKVSFTNPASKKNLLDGTQLDLNEFENFLDYQVSQKQFRARDKQATSVFHADAINKFAKFLTLEGVNVDSAKSLSSLYTTIVEQNLPLYEEEGEKLNNHISTFRNYIIDAEDGVKKESEVYGGISALEDLSPDELSEEEIVLLDKWEELQQIKLELGSLFDRYEEAQERVGSLVSEDFTLPSKAQFVDEVVNEILQPYSAILKAVDEAESLDKGSFVDAVRVEQSLKNIEDLINKILGPKANVDDTFKKYLKNAENLKKDLFTALETAKSNQSNRKLKEAKEEVLYAEALLRIVPQSVIDRISAVESVKTLSPEYAALIVSNVISEEDVQNIENDLKEKAFNFISNLPILSEYAQRKTSLSPITISKEEILSAIQNPGKGFPSIWSKLAKMDTALGAVNNTSLTNYVVDYDIVKFQESIFSYDGNLEEKTLKDLLKINLELIAQKQLKDIKSSSFSDVSFISNLIKSVSTQNLTPTKSQVRVLRDLSIFLNSNGQSNQHLFQNVASLRAPAGAGKSAVISKFFKAINKLKNKEVLTAATKQLAAENIARTTESAYPKHDIEELISNLNSSSIDPEVKVIFIDEAGALTTRQLYLLAAAHAKYNRENNKLVKLIFLYDTNQVTSGNIGYSALDLNSFSEVSLAEEAYHKGDEIVKNAYRTGAKIARDTSVVPFVQNITAVPTLSTTYRSNVVEIGDLQNVFKSEEVVKSVFTAASKNPAYNVNGILGTYAETTSSIIEVFKKSSIENPARTRAIVVGSDKKIAFYKASLPDALVLKPADIIGVTIDEIYIDITPQDNSIYNNVKVFNQHLYTALSRASLYVQFSNAPSPQFKTDPSVETRAQELSAAQSENAGEILADLNEKLDMLNSIAPISESVIETLEATPSLLVENDGIDVEIVETADEFALQAPPDIPKIENSFLNLTHASSSALVETELFDAASKASSLIVAKDISNNKERFLVLQKAKEHSAYRIVAVLTDSEVDFLNQTIDIKSLAGQNFRLDFTYGDNVLTTEDSKFDNQQVFVGNQTSPMQYVYSDKSTYSFTEDMNEDGVLSSLSLLKRHLQTMYGPEPQDIIENYSDMLENFDKYVKVVSYSTEAQLEKDFPSKFWPVEKRPKLVAPYLVISGIKLKNSSAEHKKQFIRLTSKVIDTKKAEFTPLLETISKIERLEQLLDSIKLPGKYNEVRNGRGIKTSQSNIYFPFHYLVTRLSNAYVAKQNGEPYVIQMSSKNNIKSFLPDLDLSHFSDEILKTAYEIDLLVHGKRVAQEDGKVEKRAWNGVAQKVMDSIGSQNFIVSTVKGKELLLRDYRTVGFSEKSKETVDAAGVSLLGPLTFEHSDGKSYNAKIKSKLLNKLALYNEKLNRAGKQQSPRAALIRSILEKGETAHLLPITTADLRELFFESQDGQGKLSLVSEGFGLRTPLKKDLNVKIEYKTLVSPSITDVDLSYLETSFDKVIPTQIHISTSNTAEQTSVFTNSAPRFVSEIIQIKRAIQNGTSLEGISELAKEQFKTLIGSESFEEATAEYQARISNLSSTYTLTGNNLSSATKKLLSTTHGDLKDRVLADLETSVTVSGIGKDKSKTASRDFIRVSVFLQMFPTFPPSKYKQLVLLASEYYDATKPTDQLAFKNTIENIAVEQNVSLDSSLKRLEDLIDVYNSILRDFRLPSIDDSNTLLEKVQSIVKASSDIRAYWRSLATPALPVPDLTAFASSLIRAGAEDPDLFEDLVNDPSNSSFLDNLNVLEGDTLYEKAMTLLSNADKERSLLLNETPSNDSFLTEEEVNDLLYRFYPASFVEYIKFLLLRPSLPKRFVLHNILQNKKGEKALGLYKNGVIHLLQSQDGKVGKKVVLHELFHQVFWEFFSPSERAHLLDLARQQWGNSSDEALEENLANSFMEFTPKSENIFAKFWRVLRALFSFSARYHNSINAYFNGIYSKDFRKQNSNVTVERSLINIASRFDSIEQYKLVKSLLMDTYNYVLEKRKTDEILSLDEAVIKAIDILQEIRKNPATIAPETPEQHLSIQEALAKFLDNSSTRTTIIEEFFGQSSLKTAAFNLWASDNQDLIARLQERRARLQEFEAILDSGQLLDEASSEEYDNLQRDESDGLAAENFESELRDPALKLTGAVKQKLISIKYTKKGEITFGDLHRTHSIILNRLASIPTVELSETVEIIRNLFDRYKLATEKGSLVAATGAFMYKLASRLKNALSDDSLIRKDISFRKNALHKGLYAIVSRDGSNTHNVSLYKAKTSPDKYIVITQEQGTSLAQFLKAVEFELGAEFFKTNSKNELRDAYLFFEDLDFMRALLAATASMQQSNPHVLQQKWHFGKYETTIYKVRMGGGTYGLESRITKAFSKYVASVKSSLLFPLSLVGKIQAANDRESRLAALKEFLFLIKIDFPTNAVKNIDSERLVDFFETFKAVVDTMQTTFAASVEQFENEEQWLEERSGEALLSNEAEFLFSLVAILNSYYELVDINSYTRGDAKKAYGFKDESHQSSLLTSIVRAQRGLPYKSFETFRIENGRLKTEDRFLKSNIYFTGIGQIKDNIDFDSKKVKGNSKYAKVLVKETLQDFRERHFTFGFLTRLRQTRGNSYHQYLPIPSERTTIQGVDVKVLGKSEIDKAILEIIRAQKNRPAPESNSDLATVATYVKKDINGIPSYKQFKFAGLRGDVSSMTAEQALKAVKEYIEHKSQELAKEFKYLAINQKGAINISEKDLNFAAYKFGLKKQIPFVSSTSAEEKKQKALEIKNSIIEELLPIFYANFIIQQYSLSQIIYGDEVFYAHKEDETKRIKLATATGDTMLTDDVYGLPKRTQVLVFQDLQGVVPSDMVEVLDRSFRDSYDITDAEGFILPEYYEIITQAYGTESLTDVVQKPVYFAIEKGIPAAIKFSAKVLTNEFVEDYPHFNTLRNEMRKRGISMAVPASAVKVGKPKNLSALDKESGELLPNSVTQESILSIDTNKLRWQLNPAKSVDITTANPSQITSLMNSNGKNEKEIAEIHKLNATLIEVGRNKVSRELKLTRKGSLVEKTVQGIRERIVRSVEGLPGNTDLYRLLSYKGKDKRSRVSLSLPLIADRAITAISSIISESTVGIRFAGSKLILQADIGKHKIKNPTTGKIESRSLQWRDKDGYCEVILPTEYAAFLEEGDVFLEGYQNGLVGFRIPSTNYHSMIPMKVVGFYRTPPNSKGNIIIAPSLIVYYHGSDYDVDSLFVIRKQTWTAESSDLNSIASKYDKEHKYNANLNLEKGKTVVGFDGPNRVFIGNLPVEDYLKTTATLLSSTIEILTDDLFRARLTETKKQEISTQLRELENDLNKITQAIEIAAKNTIVHIFSTNMLDIKNRKDLLTPISFARVASLKTKTAEELAELFSNEEFLFELQQAGLIELQC